MSVVHEKCFLDVHLGSVKMVLGPLPVPSRGVKVPRYYFMNLGTSWDKLFRVSDGFRPTHPRLTKKQRTINMG